MNPAQMTKSEPVRVFLTYADRDRAAAAQVDRWLRAGANLRVFTPNLFGSCDPDSGGDGLDIGLSPTDRIRLELKKADVFMLVVSDNLEETPWVIGVLGAAWAINKPIIPVLPSAESEVALPMNTRHRQPIYLDQLDSQDPARLLAQFCDN
jgi:hypothetical protein